MTPSTKYLPHLGVTAFIIFLATDYFVPAQNSVPLDSGKSLTMKEGSHKEGSHKEEGSKGEGANLSQEERERRMAIFHYNEGNKFYKEENYAEAVIRYEKALHHNKKFKEALINISTAYMKTRVFDKALETLQEGQNQFPQEPLFDYNFSCYYSLRENLGPGLSALKQAVEKGFKKFKQIESDSDLNNLRQSEEYKIWKEKMSSAKAN
ncbi:MAG: tetratricopeptide repeat protein [Nitrospinae bacterium]|nr:tetratricopeptide repeat protein [Nitrospinota bacterium]MBL7020468.1 tetratricopeptide repeat protein [Nitrospinaceae bacterium]